MTDRLIALDTETTGLESTKGHRIIEIGGVEIINRMLTKREYHHYIKPDRSVGESLKIHGITDDFLLDKSSFKTLVRFFLGHIYKYE